VGVYVDEAVEASETPTINTEALAGFLTTRSPTVTALQMHCLRQLPPSWPACLQLAMPGLQRLSLYHIHSLGELELTGVPSLSSVVVTSCAILSYVGVSSATQLTRLDCSGCLNLLSLDITGCTALEVLNLEGTALTALPLQPQHNRLRSLNVNFNEQLTSLDLCHCTALRELQANIRYCTHLVLPPGCESDVLSLGRMKLLTPDVLADLVRVVKFTCSPPKYHQTGLEILSRIPGLQQADLGGSWDAPQTWAPALPTLQQLALECCIGLVDLDLRGACSLMSLSMTDCAQLETIKVPPSLQQLHCSRLPRLCDIDLTVTPGVKATFCMCADALADGDGFSQGDWDDGFSEGDNGSSDETGGGGGGDDDDNDFEECVWE
jgi:hypothetical protein